MKTNLIRVQFLRGGQAFGREYTYRSPVDVEVGDMVEIMNHNGLTKAIVTQVNVPEEEVESFKDKLKAIQGLIKEEQE